MSSQPTHDLPAPPYYAVIFTSQRTSEDDDGNGAMAERMVALAGEQPGFLGIESARDELGFGITVSYWRDQESIARWKRDAEHRVAQARGHSTWYRAYDLRVARVERATAKRPAVGPAGR